MIYIILFFVLINLFPKIIISLGLFQQNGYKVSKYMINLKKHYFKKISSYLEYCSLLMLFFYILNKEWYIGILTMFFLIGSVMLMEPLIIFPKFTNRIKRLLITAVIISLPFYLLIPFTIVLLIESILLPWIFILSSLINQPIEKQINKYYLKKSINKLQENKPLIIGITGSFGKTSTKNFLYQLIKTNFYTYVTPKSYNTPMGICKGINEDMQEGIETFICELGATKKGDIKELVSFLDIDIGIITEIGPQHLESFKTIENILQTKLEILESKKIKYLIINNDNDYLRKYQYPNNIEIIRVGINNPSTFEGRNIVLTNNGMSFDIYLLNQFYMRVETCLLGRHNIYNILLSAACCNVLKIPKEEIFKNIKKIKPVEHRLSIKKINNFQIIDDAFNSNYVGFNNALEVLKLSQNKKILITPGLVDLGKETKPLNKKIGKQLTKGIDWIYLIKNEASKYIQDYFIEENFTSYEVTSSFKEALDKAFKKYFEETTILIENDLPDNYIRR